MLKLEILSLKYIKTKFETIQIKTKIISVVVRNAYFLVGTLKHFWKMYWILKGITICSNKCDFKLVFFSGDINHPKQWYLFCDVARASPYDDRLRALLAPMVKPETEWERLKERHRAMWTLDPKHGERFCSTEYRP